jgi:hypothetical protein
MDAVQLRKEISAVEGQGTPVRYASVTYGIVSREPEVHHMRRTRGVVRKSLICSLEPLDFLEDGTPLYPVFGAEPDDDSGDDDDDDNDDDDNDEHDEDDDEDESKKDESKKPPRKSKPKETPDQKVRRLNAEMKQRRETNEALEAKIRAIEDKDKSELEIATRDRDEATSKIGKMEATLANLAFENAFLKLDSGKYSWHDPEVALELLRKDDSLVVGDDGSVDGLAEAVKELAKKKSYLLKKESDDSEDEESTRQGGSATGSPVGSGRKSRKQDTTKAALRAKVEQKYKLGGVPIV